MARNYYYIVAGLADLAMEGVKGLPSLTEFIEDVSPQLADDDAALLRLVRYPFDNRNLLALLEKKEESFDPRGVFSQEELAALVKNPDELPAYMRAFIESRAEGRSSLAGVTDEDRLNALFYEEMTGHDNEFVRSWFAFDRDMRNVLVGLNCRRFGAQGGYTVATAVIPGGEVAELVMRSTAPDFSLGGVFPWIERILNLDPGNLVAFEQGVDTLRWEVCTELTQFTYFQIETIMAFCLKLGIVDRWRALDAQAGREVTARLIDELASGFKFPADFQ